MSPPFKQKIPSKTPPGSRCFLGKLATSQVLPKRQDPCARLLGSKNSRKSTKQRWIFQPRLFWMWNSRCWVFGCETAGRWKFQIWRMFFWAKSKGQAVNILKFWVFFLNSVQSWNYTMIKSLPRHWVIWRSIILQGLDFQLLLEFGVDVCLILASFGHVFYSKNLHPHFCSKWQRIFSFGQTDFFGRMRACQEFCGLTLSEANVFDGEWVLTFVDLKLPLFPENPWRIHGDGIFIYIW